VFVYIYIKSLIYFDVRYTYNFKLTLKEYPLNPKALTLGELYGEYNLASQEWMDGVLSSIMRKVCSGNL